MAKNLVIVESPAKARTIEKFLGKDYKVESCFGHIRDLSKNDLSVDIEGDFEPKYEIPADKKKVIATLKKGMKDAEFVWLATDEDREGEAISWHLVQALKIEEEKIKRIVFHEITKPAILEAINNPRSIDHHLVDAQQARRVLDRLVGYEISPVLWKKIKPALSAGRVQSVSVRLIVEREDEVKKFKAESSFRITGTFMTDQEVSVEAELNKRFKTENEATGFLENCKTAGYKVSAISKKPSLKNPAPPFTTSTLQQEASRKLGYSVSKTMMVAQQLYESGKITYMRTESVNLSKLALGSAKKVIGGLYGNKYVKTRQFTTKSKSAQEAHEAIRPTYIENKTIEGDNSQKRLYELIWKRTIASQMSSAEIEKTTIDINISNSELKFVAKGEVIVFDGFLKVYIESSDTEEENGSQKKILPSLKNDMALQREEIKGMERFTQAPPRYTEASLVKKMEELGIGRPSTYAPTISTIQKREYIEKGDRPGQERKYSVLVLKNSTVNKEAKTERFGFEKNKLFPTDIGTVVNNFLVEYFSEVVDYNFTANVEKEFDDIANGKKEWNRMIKEFYNPFHDTVKETLEKSGKQTGEKLLGQDPETGKNIYTKIGRYGPIVQIGEVTDEEKPKFAGLRKGQSLESITLQEALDLFRLPRSLGFFEEKDVQVAIGRFGPYIKHDNQFFSLPKDEDVFEVSLSTAIEIIENKRKQAQSNIIKEFAENKNIRVLKGRYGPYISEAKKNFRIPGKRKPEDLTLEDCLEIIKAGKAKKTRKK
ncbi:MAG: type I DNA topoisomerase [Bacteroidales bacterium]|nr:type I DNA topoisomerase [Bacteroidales bacterium]